MSKKWKWIIGLLFVGAGRSVSGFFNVGDA